MMIVLWFFGYPMSFLKNGWMSPAQGRTEVITATCTVPERKTKRSHLPDLT